jgi:hypothetical protein
LLNGTGPACTTATRRKLMAVQYTVSPLLQ